MNIRAEHLDVTPELQDKINFVRQIFSDLYDDIEDVMVNSREKSLVLTKLEEAQMWAIKGISREEVSKDDR